MDQFIPKGLLVFTGDVAPLVCAIRSVLQKYEILTANSYAGRN